MAVSVIVLCFMDRTHRFIRRYKTIAYFSYYFQDNFCVCKVFPFSLSLFSAVFFSFIFCHGKNTVKVLRLSSICRSTKKSVFVSVNLVGCTGFIQHPQLISSVSNGNHTIFTDPTVIHWSGNKKLVCWMTEYHFESV